MSALVSLAADINREHALAFGKAYEALEHARRAGELLLEAKAGLKHGEWLPWLSANVPFSERTAQGYMRLASRWPELEAKSATVADLPLRSALAALTEPKDDESERDDEPQREPDDAWSFRAQPLLQSLSVEWFTPARYIEAARTVLGEIDLDPASCAEANRTVRAARYFTREDDGLAQPWRGRVWCNPPYSGEAGKFATKLHAEYQAGAVEAGILLVNAQATPNQWFAPLWEAVLCFTDHRVPFIPGGGQPTSHPTFGAVFAYFGPEPARFAEVFAQIGTIVRRWPHGVAA